MSVENLREYAQRCANDPVLLAKAKEFGLMDVEQHMQQSETLGLDWTMDDLVAFRKEVIDSGEDLEDLSEEELEQVAGGIATIGVAVVVAVIGTSVAVGAGAGAAAGTAATGGGTAAGDGGW